MSFESLFPQASASSAAAPPKQFPSKAVAGTTKLPGFGAALNDVPKTLLPNALSRRSMKAGQIKIPLVTLRELSMLRLMEEMCSILKWNLKINDPEMVKKWKAEMFEGLSEPMANWCIAEVQHRAAAVTDPECQPPVFVFNGDVYCSDSAVPVGLKCELKKAVDDFEARIPTVMAQRTAPEGTRHLVDPSLFPLVYGLTRVLPDKKTVPLDDCITRSGEGVIIPVPNDMELEECGVVINLEMEEALMHQEFNTAGNHLNFPNPYSKKFQWLPCEVDISKDKARITSYINNLHPVKDKALYGLIEQLVDAAIPLWELTLAPLSTGEEFQTSPRIPYKGPPVYDLDVDTLKPCQGPQRRAGESDHLLLRRVWDWVETTRKLIRPEPHEVFDPSHIARPPPFNLRSCGTNTLQVIVKVHSIHLTPENPKYLGEDWKLDGQLNERIVATALYYYSNENVTQSKLRFRQQTHATPELYWDDPDITFLEDFFGCQHHDDAVQELGGLRTYEGRLITYPNILQHRADPFELVDPCKPGHRKIVALYLVDPGLAVISTANVPCQRKDWWWDEVNAPQTSQMKSGRSLALSQGHPVGLDKLTPEIKDRVSNAVEGFPITMDEAKALRLEMVDERKAMADEHNIAFTRESSFFLNDF